MNREQAKKLLPLITAFAEGKEIQYKGDKGEWIQTNNPQWTLYAIEFRIKPEPVVVEKWACAHKEDGRVNTFSGEQGARDFARLHGAGLWIPFIMRGTYER